MLPVRVRCNTCGAIGPYNGHEEEEEEEKHEVAENALESLEKRTKVSKREIEVMAALDEIKSMKSRRASRSTIDQEKKDEVLDEKKKPKKRVGGTSTAHISSVRIVAKKTAELPRELEALCHNYGTNSDEK
ncbi:hypothetical protein DY000_02030182 [Brassica cretica]|uniref:Uncharacterized protein n=1 Tax=Brassica cretica TaxID=69181 RepID=A0ABQ7DUM3_BRACR|nr:hypothetical protein DY000_02030182 [Brassica cretica]